MAVVAMKVGDVDVLVEATSAPGTEGTSSKTEKAAEKLADAFQSAERTIVAICERVASAYEDAQAPAEVVVEFGLKFSATGDVIVSQASGEASLKVTAKYEFESKK